MSQPQLAVGTERLPWLDDEPQRPAASRRKNLLPWAVAGMLVVAAGWMGPGSWTAQDVAPRPKPAITTVPLPEAQPPVPQPQVEPMPAPQVEPVRAPTVAVPRVEKPVAHSSAPASAQAEKNATAETSGTAVEKTAATEEGKPEAEEAASADTASAKATSSASRTAKSAATAAAPAKRPLKLWPATESKGASGRLVQIGAFGSRQQAKLGWKRMTRDYPAVGRLPATVVSARNSRGRTFYRFQIGTTSQAHSEVLCQRMHKITFSCAVVDVSGKPKVER